MVMFCAPWVGFKAVFDHRKLYFIILAWNDMLLLNIVVYFT